MLWKHELRMENFKVKTWNSSGGKELGVWKNYLRFMDFACHAPMEK
jgi:hypothetical protein